MDTIVDLSNDAAEAGAAGSGKVGGSSGRISGKDGKTTNRR